MPGFTVETVAAKSYTNSFPKVNAAEAAECEGPTVSRLFQAAYRFICVQPKRIYGAPQAIGKPI